MNVSAAKREFHIFSLFLHDGESVYVKPFSQWAVALRLNILAEKIFPDLYIRFICPDESFASSHWAVRFGPSRYDLGDDGEPHAKNYPTERVYDERTFRRQLPPELDEALLELNKASMEL